METIRSIPLVMVVNQAVGTKVEIKVEVRVTLKQSWIKLKMCLGRLQTGRREWIFVPPWLEGLFY